MCLLFKFDEIEYASTADGISMCTVNLVMYVQMYIEHLCNSFTFTKCLCCCLKYQLKSI